MVLKCKCWISLSLNGLSQHSSSPLRDPLEKLFELNKLDHKSSTTVASRSGRVYPVHQRECLEMSAPIRAACQASQAACLNLV